MAIHGNMMAYMIFTGANKTKQLVYDLHACLKRVNREYMTNSSLLARFDVDKKNSSMISRLLNETSAQGLIYIPGDSSVDKTRKYLPFWA